MADQPDPGALARAAALGCLSGARTFAAAGVLALRGRWGRGAGRAVVLVAALGELAGDKHPAVPARTAPPALLGRMLSGAVLGATSAGPLGAAIGSGAAAGAAFATQRARAALGTATGFPDALLGAAEDVLVVTLAAVATHVPRELPLAPGPEEP